MTRGGLCVKLKDFHDHHAQSRPADVSAAPRRARRARPRRQQFERITWDEAISEIGRRWREIIAEYGAQAIMPQSYLGNMGLVQGINSGDPFFNRLGSTVNEKTYCTSGSSTAWLLTHGPDGRRRPGKLRALQVHRDLGLQFDLDQPAPLAVRARGAEARRQGRRHRFATNRARPRPATGTSAPSPAPTARSPWASSTRWSSKAWSTRITSTTTRTAGRS